MYIYGATVEMIALQTAALIPGIPSSTHSQKQNKCRWRLLEAASATLHLLSLCCWRKNRDSTKAQQILKLPQKTKACLFLSWKISIKKWTTFSF